MLFRIRVFVYPEGGNRSVLRNYITFYCCSRILVVIDLKLDPEQKLGLLRIVIQNKAVVLEKSVIALITIVPI